MVDNQVCVDIALFAESHFIHQHPEVWHTLCGTFCVHALCIHTVLPVAKSIYPICMCC
jgi:hypothetical protein